MSFTFTIFLKGVLDGNGFVVEILTVHSFNGCVRKVKVVVGNEAVAFGFS